MLLLHWLVVFAGLAGLGSLCLPGAASSDDRLFDAFWCGAFLASACVQVIHLFLPIGGSVALALIVAGLLVGFRRKAALYRIHVRPLTIGLLALFVLWATMASLHEPPQWDFGLYHLPAVRWAQACAVVPGLANLHWPLGHTSSFFTLTAAFDDRGMTWVQSYHVMAAVFVLVLAAEGCTALVRREAPGPSAVFRAFGVVFAAILVGNWLPTLSPDLAVAVVGYSAASRLAAFTLENPSTRTADALRVLLLLAGLGITLKLTTGIYFAALAAVALASAPRRLRTWRSLGPVAGLVTIFVSAWCATSVVQSGYPLYPATVLPFPASWTVPANTVRDHVATTLWHTRGTGAAPASHWIAHWLRTVVWTAGKFQVLLPLGLGAVTLVIALARRHVVLTRELFIFLLPGLIGCGAWLLAAPEPRFAGAIFWHTGIGVAAWALGSKTATSQTARFSLRAAVPLLIATYLLTASRGRDLEWPWSVPAVPAPPRLTRVSVGGGLVISVPVTDDRCLDAPRPCTPDAAQGLALRRPPDLASGFTASPLR